MMNKLQYDSFYKFMVSIGVVLVAAPLVGLYYLLCNGNQILISQIEYDALSTTSMQFLQTRDNTILKVLYALPWVLSVLFLGGLACLIYGAIKWYGIQKYIDKQTKLKTQEQEYNFEKLTTAEVVTKVIDETANENDSPSNQTMPTSDYKERLVKAIEIENLCYAYLQKQHSIGYSVQPNVKVKNYAFDIVAVSKIDKTDYIFEVKYWTKLPNIPLLNHVSKRITNMCVEYEQMSNRNGKCILMIVTLEDLKDEVLQFCKKFATNYPCPFDIQVYTENELK